MKVRYIDFNPFSGAVTVPFTVTNGVRTYEKFKGTLSKFGSIINTKITIIVPTIIPVLLTLEFVKN